jgi:hypoxanthine phosphoribosyltransferase
VRRDRTRARAFRAVEPADPASEEMGHANTMTPTATPSAETPGADLRTIRVMYSAEQITARVREMGLEIARDYDGKRPMFVGVLKGACMFQCDLARATPMDVELDFLSVSSYGASTTSSGNVRLLADLRANISGRHVILCEGVVDSGLSMSFILDLLRLREPASLKVAALLDKRPCRKIEVPVDYVGWTIGSEFVIGYGMDVAEQYRNLPFVGVIEGS